MGGGNISFINMISGLYDKGVEAYIAYPDKKIDEVFYQRTKDIVKGYYHVRMGTWFLDTSETTLKRMVKNICKRIMYLNPLCQRQETMAVKQIIREVQPDIVHTNVGVIRAGYYAAKETNIPHIWHVREYQTKGLGWRIFPTKEAYESLLRHSYVITISKDLINHFNLTGLNNVKCVYNGCFSEKEVTNIYPKQKYFLCCSQITKQKGLDEAIKAFSVFKENRNYAEYRLLIAGFGKKSIVEDLRKLSREVQCGDTVDFIGYQEDVCPFLDNATALIVSSQYEGFGRMTAEACFRGCLVIGNNTGGTKEIIEQTGGFHYTGSYLDLADKMKTVAELDENQYIDQMKKSQCVAVELFSNERCAESVFEIYKDIIKSHI